MIHVDIVISTSIATNCPTTLLVILAPDSSSGSNDKDSSTQVDVRAMCDIHHAAPAAFASTPQSQGAEHNESQVADGILTREKPSRKG